MGIERPILVGGVIGIVLGLGAAYLEQRKPNQEETFLPSLESVCVQPTYSMREVGENVDRMRQVVLEETDPAVTGRTSQEIADRIAARTRDCRQGVEWVRYGEKFGL